MSEQKIYSPREAAVAVLNKAKEMLEKSSVMAKSEKPKGEIEPKEKEQAPSDNVEQTNKDAVPRDGNQPEETEKNPDAKEDAKLGENVESLVEEHEKENPEAEAEEGHHLGEIKGHLKLAKFIGRMEHKRSNKSAAPAMEQPSTPEKK